MLTFHIDFGTNELAGGTTPIQRTIVPYWKDAIGLGSIIYHTMSEKMMEMVTNLLMTNLSLTRGSHQAWHLQKGNFNNGEHTLLPVTTKMIHSAVWECERLILKDGQPLHMVKFVGAVRNFSVNTKYVQIDVEDGTGHVRVILWRNKRECTAQHCLLDECNSYHYICVIGEVKDYYGVHKIIAFDVQPVSSGNEVHISFFGGSIFIWEEVRICGGWDVESCSSRIIYLRIIKLMFFS
jgi:hypothetical protein